MDATALLVLMLACAPQVHVDTARALVQVESGFNPWAIGVVGGALLRQPRNLEEALATARSLQRAGWNFSVGLAQINVGNFARLCLTVETAFSPCTNLAGMQVLLRDCYDRAAAHDRVDEQPALRRALSCYYGGDFTTGLRHGYVRRVLVAAAGFAQSDRLTHAKGNT